HETNRRILRDLLTSAGYELTEAVTGEEGVTLAETYIPDLILMDIQLPGLDGYEATRRIKKNPALRHIPIIAVTSYALNGDEEKRAGGWVRGLVSKPFPSSGVLGKSRRILPIESSNESFDRFSFRLNPPYLRRPLSFTLHFYIQDDEVIALKRFL